MSLSFFLAKGLGARLGLSQIRSISTTARVNATHWNKDWRPAVEPPTTEDGKRAAAKKYGLIREDYETYTPDGTGYGDYPKLPLISGESRDPHALYDYPELKRNFGEPMHVDCDMVGEDRWDYNRRFLIPMRWMVTIFLSIFFGGLGIFYVCEYVRVVPVPMMKRHMYKDGKKYYTYEFEDVE